MMASKLGLASFLPKYFSYDDNKSENERGCMGNDVVVELCSYFSQASNVQN